MILEKKTRINRVFFIVLIFYDPEAAEPEAAEPEPEGEASEPPSSLGHPVKATRNKHAAKIDINFFIILFL